MTSRSARASEAIQWLFWGAVVLGLATRTYEIVTNESGGGWTKLLDAVDVRFGVLVAAIFLLEILAGDQATTYTGFLLFIDLINCGLFLLSCFALGIGFLPSKGLHLGFASAVIVTEIFMQLLWRRVAGGKDAIQMAHWDFRFLVAAAIGFAFATPGRSQFLYLGIAFALSCTYVWLGLNAPSRHESDPSVGRSAAGLVETV